MRPIRAVGLRPAPQQQQGWVAAVDAASTLHQQQQVLPGHRRRARSDSIHSGTRWLVEQKLLDIPIRPDRPEGFLQNPPRFVVAFLLPAIGHLSVISGQSRRSTGVIGLCSLHGIAQNLEVIVDQFHEPIFFLLIDGANESHKRRENGGPSGKFAHLFKGRDHSGFKATLNAFGKLITNRGKIDDGRGDTGGAGNDVGAEHRQIKARIGKKDAMKDLQPESKSCDFQVQFAQSTTCLLYTSDAADE